MLCVVYMRHVGKCTKLAAPSYIKQVSTAQNKENKDPLEKNMVILQAESV